MAREDKYSIQDLKKHFPNDDACLEFIFDMRHSRKCSCGGSYSRLTGRKQFQCSRCRFQIAPTADSIFHKSSTPLTLWFHAIWIFSNAKSGISAKEMERQLGVTYKCAWRMLKMIRMALKQDGKLEGIVEMDSAFFGGKAKAGPDNKSLREALKNKSIVMGAIERGGDARVVVVPNNSAKSHGDFLNKYVHTSSALMTDSSNRYDIVAAGYKRYSVNHQWEYARGPIHVNTVESFWAHIKRSIRGTHKVVSKHHLQSYLNAFVFHYNNRGNDSDRFSVLVKTLLHA